jgi:hypothetical protein
MRHLSFYGQKRVKRGYSSKVSTGEIPVSTGPVDFLNRTGTGSSFGRPNKATKALITKSFELFVPDYLSLLNIVIVKISFFIC